jgi:hypothetical protein
MVRDEGILAHLRELDEATGDWERYRSTITLEDLRTDRDKRNMVLSRTPCQHPGIDRYREPPDRGLQLPAT